MTRPAPEWRALVDPLHRLLTLLHAAGITPPSELRVLVPKDYPPPWAEVDMPVTTILMIPVEYTDAVTRPVLGCVLDLG